MLALLAANLAPHDTKVSPPASPPDMTRAGSGKPSRAIRNVNDELLRAGRMASFARTYARRDRSGVVGCGLKMVKFAMGETAGKRVERLRRRRFETLVARALDGLPPHIVAMLDNVEIVVEDEPTPEQRGQNGGDDALFGLYEGIPLVARDSGYAMTLPDRIIIFRRPLERACRSPAEIAREVRITVLHELGHHFGFDEDRLEELGLG
jgi:predicted Zn-dependent protease with MMP-like domain